MSVVFMAGSLLAILLACMLLTRLVRPAGPVDAVLLFWLFLTADIVAGGLVLSSLNDLAKPGAWLAAGVASALLVLLVAASRPFLRTRCFARFTWRPPVSTWWRQFRALSATNQFRLGVLGLAVLATSIMNLAEVVLVAPHNWDSMTYHLARVGYFLQHGNLHIYPANFWAQVVHPRNGPILLLYTFLASGRRENLFQLVQFIAYFVAMTAVYGISRRTGHRRSGSLFAAFVFGLLTEVLMEAVTTQDDLLCTAYLGVSVYFLFAARQLRSRRHLAFASLSLGLMLGVKSATLLALPAVGVVAIYAILMDRHVAPRLRRERLALFAAASLLAISAFALPSGYIENWRTYHHPIGPASVRREHSFEGAPLSRIAQQGTTNLFRYGVEFLTLDGLPPVEPVVTAQRALRWVPAHVLPAVGIPLGSNKYVRAPMFVFKAPTAQEDNSYWGVLGFALVWPLAAVALFRRKSPGAMRALAIASLAFTLAEGYCGPYDRWRGRYFILAGVIAVPLVARCLQAWRGKWLSKYLSAIVVVGATSGVLAVVYRQNRPVLGNRRLTNVSTSAFKQGRLEQLMATRPWTFGAMRAFDKMVPVDAHVAVLLPPDSYEYPLFGEGFTRRLVPARRDVDVSDCDFFLFARSFASPNRGDALIGDGMYLRRLSHIR